MKAFASALLMAGAYAAAGAIDFDIKAENLPVATLSSNIAFLALYGPKASNVKVLSDSKVSYKISTDHAKKQFTLEMVMVAAHEGSYDLASTKTMIEIYQCWKDSSLSNYTDDGLKGLKCHVFGTKYGANKKMSLFYRMYSMKTPGTDLAPSGTNLKTKSDGSYLFYEGTDNSTKLGFKNDKIFTPIYAATKAEAEIKNTDTVGALSEVNHDGGKKAVAADVNLSKVPVVTVAKVGTAGFGWTVTATITPKASTDFYTNGKLYSAAA